MKKSLYYVIPFVAIPILILLCEVLDNKNLLQINFYIFSALLLLFSFAMGFFSTTNKTFDYLLTAIMPLSLFCFMFVVGFLDKECIGGRFQLYRAINVAFQPIALQWYFLMAITAFLASFKRFRNIKNLFKK